MRGIFQLLKEMKQHKSQLFFSILVRPRRFCKQWSPYRQIEPPIKFCEYSQIKEVAQRNKKPKLLDQAMWSISGCNMVSWARFWEHESLEEAEYRGFAISESV